MKKILLSMLLICSLESASLAASEDVYVRQDVFDAKMEAFMAEIRGEFQKINIKFEALDKRISDSEAHTSNRIDDLKTMTSSRIEDLKTMTLNRIDDLQATTSNRIEDLKTMVYWGFSILGLLVAFAIFAPSFSHACAEIKISNQSCYARYRPRNRINVH